MKLDGEEESDSLVSDQFMVSFVVGVSLAVVSVAVSFAVSIAMAFAVAIAVTFAATFFMVLQQRSLCYSFAVSRWHSRCHLRWLVVTHPNHTRFDCVARTKF